MAFLSFEANRLKTFGSSWPHSFISVRDLALTGFFYLGPYDMVQCYFCNLRLHDWKENDIVALEHYFWSPHCSFLKCHTATTNVTMTIASPDELLSIIPPISYDEVDNNFYFKRLDVRPNSEAD